MNSRSKSAPKQNPIVEKIILEWGDELLTMDGFDDCIIGVVERFDQLPIVCYDYEKVIAQLMTTMTREEAVEYYAFNQLGAGMGDLTPCFLHVAK